MDYVGLAFKTHVKTGINIHETSRNLELKAGAAKMPMQFWFLEPKYYKS